MLTRLLIVLALLAAVLIAPFAMRPDPETGGASMSSSEKLVIITPHNESIQSEFGNAFARHMKKAHDREVIVDWRQPGGTSVIAKFLSSEYSARFETLWKKQTRLPFSTAIKEGYQNRKLEIPDRVTSLTQQGKVTDSTGLDELSKEERAGLARQMFLESDIGVGIDLFFGGGAYDFSKQASIGNLVPADASGKYGPGALPKQRPDWFSDAIMPESASGEPFRDPEYRWVGTVLSSFGICYNTDILTRLGIDEGLSRWDDLTDPRLAGQIALADPTKSGSTTKAFEMLIQEQIQRLVRDGMEEDSAVREGWNNAIQMIMQISANSRYFTDSAAKVPRDVALGDAAAGMCIDFYGRTFNEIFQKEDGDSHVQFVIPRQGTSIGADPIGMLRGAPSPELAHLFVEFVLSPEGQNLWNLKPGVEGGPKRFSLRRPPIRKDFYELENSELRADPDLFPYDLAKDFIYYPERTGSLFASLRFVIRCACIEPHHEQKEAWEALIDSGMPKEKLAEFLDVSGIDYDSVLSEIAPVLGKRDKVAEIRLARSLSSKFRERYEEIAGGAK